MTFAPPTIKALAVFMSYHGGVNLGIVGDVAHQTRGNSYHLGEDLLTADAYSRVTARDKAGLSLAASAYDLGRIDGSLTKLQNFSKWLVSRAQINAPGTRDIREIIYSPDGVAVRRWDRERGYASATTLMASTALNNSHRTHTHVSFYRDAEFRDHTTAFRPYFDTQGDDDMLPLTTYLPGQIATVKATANIRSAPSLTATVLRGLTVAEKWTVIGFVKGDVDPDGGSDQWLVRWSNGRYEFTAKSNISSGPAAPVVAAPDDGYTKATQEAAVAAATAPLTAQIAALKPLADIGSAAATLIKRAIDAG